MTPQELITHYGNKVKTAAAMGVSVTSVNNWVGKGKVPMMAQLAAQALTKNKLVADKEVV